MSEQKFLENKYLKIAMGTLIALLGAAIFFIPSLFNGEESSLQTIYLLVFLAALLIAATLVYLLRRSQDGLNIPSIAAGTSLLILASYFSVPIPYLTTSLDVVAIFAILIGIFWGWKTGIIITLLYSVFHAASVPMILTDVMGSLTNSPATHHGRHFFFSPYLIIASACAAMIASRGKQSHLRIFLAALAGHTVILGIWVCVLFFTNPLSDSFTSLQLGPLSYFSYPAIIFINSIITWGLALWVRRPSQFIPNVTLPG